MIGINVFFSPSFLLKFPNKLDLSICRFFYISHIRYKRLMFGVSCAPELFQKVMESILANLDGIIIYLDDIVVHGKTQTEHDEKFALF